MENYWSWIEEWMSGQKLTVPRRASGVELLESIAEQMRETARQEGYDAGYETAKENYSEDQR